MKKLSFILLVLLSMQLAAQETNSLTIDERTGKQMLIGVCNYEAFADTNFAGWYNSGYETYEINDSIITELNLDPNQITITVVLGTWCSDSRREFPHFTKLMDFIGFPRENIKIIAVNRSKVTAGNDVKDLEIEFVPTFIVYKNGKEIGRIIEAPTLSLEADLASIIKIE